MDHLAVPPCRPGIERLLHQIVVLFVMAPAEAHQIVDPPFVAAEGAGRVQPDPVRAPVVVLVARVVGDQLVPQAEIVLAGFAVPGQGRHEPAPLVVEPALEFGRFLRREAFLLRRGLTEDEMPPMPLHLRLLRRHADVVQISGEEEQSELVDAELWEDVFRDDPGHPLGDPERMLAVVQGEVERRGSGVQDSLDVRHPLLKERLDARAFRARRGSQLLPEVGISPGWHFGKVYATTLYSRLPRRGDARPPRHRASSPTIFRPRPQSLDQVSFHRSLRSTPCSSSLVIPLWR